MGACAMGTSGAQCLPRLHHISPLACLAVVALLVASVTFDSEPIRAQCMPVDPDLLEGYGIPFWAQDWSCIDLTAEEETAANRRASLYGEDGHYTSGACRQDNRQVPDVPSVFYYNATSQPYWYHLNYYGTITATEEAFYHTTDPASLTAISTGSSIRLNWQPDLRLVAYNQLNAPPVTITTYTIWRSDNGAPFAELVTLTNGETTYEDTANLTVGHTYAYRVESVFAESPHPYAWIVTVAHGQPPSIPAFWLKTRTHTETVVQSGGAMSVALRFGCYGAVQPGDLVELQTWRIENFQLVARTYPLGLDGSDYVTVLNGAADEARSLGGFHFRLAFTRGGQTSYLPQPEGGAARYYVTNLNNRVIGRGFPQYQTRPTSSDWRDILAQVVNDWTGSGGLYEQHEGLFLDNPFTQLPSWHVLAMPADYEGHAAFAAAMADILIMLRQQLGPSRLLYLNSYDPSQVGMIDNGYPVADGGMVDGLSVNNDNRRTGEHWVHWFGLLHTAANALPTHQFILMSHARENQTMYRLMDMASYLLAQNASPDPEAKDTLIGFRVRKRLGEPSDPPNFGLYAEQMLTLGEPLTSIPPEQIPEIDCDPYENQGCENLPPVQYPRHYTRCFERGVVIVDCADPGTGNYEYSIASAGCNLPPTVYKIVIDDRRLVDGGTIASDPITVTPSTTITTEPGTGTILMFNPINSPEAEADCVYQLYADGTTQCRLAVHADHSSPLWIEVTDEGSSPKLFEGTLHLVDNGAGGDLQACDGIYTALIGPLAANYPIGFRELRLFMQDVEGIARYTYVTARVARPAKYTNKSSVTGVSFPGTPYSVVPLDYDNDGLKDLFITVKDFAGKLFRQDRLDANEQTPHFVDRTDQAFDPGPAPGTAMRGVAVADVDNDGDKDVFVAGSSNARLYRNNGLPDFKFEDIADDLEINDFLQHSWAGSWGDYDGDARVDLLICASATTGTDPTPEMAANPVYLLKNTTTEGTISFTDVTGPAFDADPVLAAVSAAWGDMDQDADLDLIIGDERNLQVLGGGRSATHFYRNDGDGTFTYEPLGTLKLHDGYLMQDVDAVALADFDNSGTLDLIVAQNPPFADAWVHFNDGTGSFLAEAPVRFELERTIDVRPFDQDLDGWMDALFFPIAAGSPVHLMLNHPSVTLGTSSFDDITAYAQLADGGLRADGVAIVDFNGDGDLDLFVGRQTAGSKFFYKAGQAGQEAPTNNWVGVRLLPSGANNEACLGAQVTVHLGDFQQVQVVDGGSGRGGQGDNLLIWGLGQLTGAITATTAWPNGQSQQDNLTINAVNDVQDRSFVQALKELTVTCRVEAKGEGKVDWIFEWETEYACRAALDEVKLTDPTYCDNQISVSLRPGDPGVVASVTPLAGGGYFHSLRWVDAPCQVCNYTYTVSSATDNQRCTSSPREKRIKVCLW